VNVPFFIAFRYLRARRSVNAIHLLSRLSVLGMGLGTCALILVMSVFNGFESLVFSLTNKFNPDIAIRPVRGKSFRPDTLWLDSLRQIEGVAAISMVLEENALFAYDEVQDIGILKGVDSAYARVSQVGDRMIHGVFRTGHESGSSAVIGAGIASKLGVDTRNVFEPLTVFMPNRKRSGPLDQPFQRRLLQTAGIFSIQPDIDMEYVLTDLAFVQSITAQPGQASALEVSLLPGVSSRSVSARLMAIAGPEFLVQDRIQQEASFLRIMNIEKWVAFAIMCLIMLLVAFNVAGTLWMIVSEKKPDIAILKTMGASPAFVQRIFLLNGLLLCGTAFLFGALAAMIFYLLQQWLGIIPVPPGFIIDAYPMELRPMDFLVVLATVMCIGALAAWLPARRAARMEAIIKEE